MKDRVAGNVSSRDKKFRFWEPLEKVWARYSFHSTILSMLGGASVMDRSFISEADILRSREDPRLRQLLLARSLEQLLTSLHKTQRSATVLAPRDVQHLREGAMMAVELADRIRAIDENLRAATAA